MNARRPWLPQMSQLLPEDPAPQPGGLPPAPVPAPPPAKPAGAFTQADIDRYTTEARDRGARQAQAALLADLGITDAAEAKTLLAQAQAARDAQLSDQQRATQAADAARAAADKERADAAAERVTFRKQSALLQAGMPLQVPSPDGKTTVDNPHLSYALRLIDVDAAADPAAVSAAVAKLKTDLPALFAAPAAAPTGNPGPPPRGTSNSGTAGAAGKARAAAYAAQRPGAPRPTA